MEIFNAVRSQNTAIQQVQSGHEGATIRKDSSMGERSIADQANEVNEKHQTEKIKKELKEVVQKLNEEMQSLRTSIHFGFDDKVDELYVSVIDTKTHEEIRKIPSEEALKLAAKMRELIGMLFDKKG